MEITLGNGTVECNTLTREGRIGILLRPHGEAHLIGGFTDTGGEQYYPEEHPDHVVIWLDKIESARILQDTINGAILKMQGIPQDIDPCAVAGYHVCGRLEHEHLTKGQI